ncbi:MAG: Peptidoglycan/LPS O-acetylase OafA/YrhL, contains acyltransferase and SGNH-hydrolase domain [Mucilaginibacter sp.]|nr:Peptidoglycan/LPS O-acetylase OafA/YrhL, contains acyltransferase and SGNH-hydrolase domain [Mucilaginibacter sp.]
MTKAPTIKSPRVITGFDGVILDGLRILAALMVFVFHILYLWFHPLTVLYKIDDLAHLAVIIFFVLSGYVIAYTTTETNRGGMQYMQARFSKLSSVVLPALLITAICEIIVSNINPEMHSYFSRGNPLLRYIISGLFLNEIWFFSAAPAMNGPLWSLSFEFWYYVIFGLWFYRKTGWRSYLLPVLACLVAGPKILLMMPIWLTGYFAYRIRGPKLSSLFSWLLVLLSFTIVFLVVKYISPLPFKIGKPPLYFASQFISDWIVGFFIGLALWLIPASRVVFKQSKQLRTIANLTFPLYVLHNPLLILWSVAFHNKFTKVADLWLPFSVVLTVSVILGIALEKQRYLWVNLFKYLSQFYIRKRNYLSRRPT